LTPLHIAAKYGNPSCVQAILNVKDVVVDARDVQGNSPLHYLAERGLLDEIKLCISKSCNVPELLHWKNRNGHTALDCSSDSYVDKNLPIFAHELDKLPPVDEIVLKKRSEVHIYLKQEMEKIPKIELKDPFRLQICSDLHVEFYDEVPKLLVPSAPYAALLGDIGVVSRDSYRQCLLQEAENFKRVFVVAGNHEFYDGIVDPTIEKMKKICEEHKNLQFCHRTSVLVDGIRLLGCTLWSFIPDEHKLEVEMSMSDFRVIKLSPNKTDTLTAKEFVKYHLEDLEFLKVEIEKAKKNNEKVVVMTHHAPLRFACGDPSYDKSPSNHGFCTDLTYLFGPPVVLWAYGHTHWYQDMTVKGTRILSNPSGYPRENKEPIYDSSCVVEL